MQRCLVVTSVLLALATIKTAKAEPGNITYRFTPDQKTADASIANTNAHSGYIWQGFEHEWNRRVMGVFRTPHRISKLGSEILDEDHQLNLDGELTSKATLRMQQSTGVDGDWMEPVLHYQTFHSAGVEARRGHLEVEFADNTEALGKTGNALSSLEGSFTFRTASELSENASTQALIHGFSLETRCIEGAGPDAACNSNGIWPYRFKIELSTCTRRFESLGSGNTWVRCGFQIEIGRAWTPRKGGLPPFEIKPLNRKTHYHLKVGLQILSGEPHQFAASTLDLGATYKSAHPRGPGKTLLFATTQHGDTRYQSATLGIRSLEYDFRPHQPLIGQTQAQDMGRYLSGIGTSVLPETYYPEGSSLDFQVSEFTHVPGTVKDADLTVSTGLTFLQFASESAVSEPLMNRGLLCVNSSPQAPAFSRWEKCGEILGESGASRDTAELPIELRRSLR